MTGPARDMLAELGAPDTIHPSGTLVAHLRGTYERLVRWECADHVCAAGLYHSVYGTEAFRRSTVPLVQRDRVRERIGERAEGLVYLYCVIVRASLYDNLDRGAPYRVVERATGAEVPLADIRQLADLLTLDVANRLEQLPRTTMSLRRMESDRRIYEKAVPLLPAAAVSELRRVYRRRSLAILAVDGLFRRLRHITRA